VSLAAITLCVISQRVFVIVVYFIIESVRKLLDTPSYLLVPNASQASDVCLCVGCPTAAGFIKIQEYLYKVVLCCVVSSKFNGQNSGRSPAPDDVTLLLIQSVPHFTVSGAITYFSNGNGKVHSALN
jgi:hypothetical protein